MASRVRPPRKESGPRGLSNTLQIEMVIAVRGLAARAGPPVGSVAMRSETYLWFVRGLGLAFGVTLTLAVLYGVVLSARVLVLVFIALLLASGVEPLIERMRTRSFLG